MMFEFNKAIFYGCGRPSKGAIGKNRELLRVEKEKKINIGLRRVW